MTETTRPFADLPAALEALSESELISDVRWALGDRPRRPEDLAAALAELELAETVETLADFEANVREAHAALARSGRKVLEAAAAELIARCAEVRWGSGTVKI